MKEQHGFISKSKRPKTDEVPALRSFSNYDLVQRLAVGGMGEVFLARQRTAFNREVAVKIIRQDLVNDPVARQRFLREAEMGSYLKHDHILPLLEFGEEQGRLFIVTPYVRGGTLAQRLERGSLTISEVHELFTALVRAVSYLHKRGIVHRDLKPGNILLDKEEDGDRVYVRLIDFGIATAQGLPISSPASLTAADTEVGTAAYMAPERLDGVAAPSNDIYSLGIILYVMLTGVLPDHGNMQQLPAPLTSVISRCLAVHPQDRFATADDLFQAFEHAYKSLTSPGLPAIRRLPQSQQRASSPDAFSKATGSVQREETRSEMRPAVAANLPDIQTMVAPPIESNTDRTSPGAVAGPARRSFANDGPNSVKYAVNRSGSGEHRRSGEHRIVGETRHSGEYVTPAGAVTANTVLPPIPGKKHSFDKTVDYDAPTMEISHDEKKKFSLVATAAPISQLLKTPKVRSQAKTKKKRKGFGVSLFALISVSIVLVLGVMVAIGYVVYENSSTASVTIAPRVKTVSDVYTFTAQPDLKNTNMAAGQVPAGVFTSTKSASLQGGTSGVTGCRLAIFDCKQAVSLGDISYLSSQLLPGLKTQINQDLSNQAHAAGATAVGDVFYTNNNVTAVPPLGSVGTSVTVTLTEQGSVEYFKASDVQSLALQKLQGKLGNNYTFINSSTHTGTPVVRNIDTNGVITLVVAVAGAASYRIPDTVVSDIQNRIKGEHLQDAQSVINQYPDLDPTSFSVHLSYGDTVPTNVQQIKVIQLAPAKIPDVQLPKVSGSGTQ